MIDPSEIEVAGPTVTFDVTSDGPTPHNFSVRNEGGEILMATADLSVGDNETISAELEPGTYTIFCSLAGHESLGMTGTLTVTGSQGLRPSVRWRSWRSWRREISPREAIGQLAAVTCPWLSRGAIGGEVGRQNGLFLAGTFTR